MSFVLSQDNVLTHLKSRHISVEESSVVIEPKLAKNFNLLVTDSVQTSFLVKQETCRSNGHRKGDLRHEWRLHQLIQQHDLSMMLDWMSNLIDFDPDRDVAIFRYWSSYQDLSQVYESTSCFPPAIAAALGTTLARIHASTLDSTAIAAEFATRQRAWDVTDAARLADSLADSGAGSWVDPEADSIPDSLEDWGLLPSDRLGQLSTAGLKFYQLYQRYTSLPEAIATLKDSLDPCCLTHNDLKLNNILLHPDWNCFIPERRSSQEPAIAPSVIRIIDWEKWEWGEPASDLGALVASYLKRWLNSLLVSPGVALEQSLRLAEVPLEAMQPSLIALIGAYLQQFPTIIDRYPTFLERVLQFAGCALIDSIQAGLHYYEPFGNREICTLQVAKTLLGDPIAARESLFGQAGMAIAQGQWTVQGNGRENDWNTSRQTEHGSQGHQQDPERSHPTVLTASGDRVAPHPPAIPALAPVSEASVPSAIASETYASQDWLTDIAHNLQIHSPAQIEHPDYEPLDLPDSLLAHYSSLSPDGQQQQLSCQLMSCQLSHYLYRIYWSGEQRPRAEIAQAPSEKPTALQNDQYRGINAAFYAQLHQANQGQGYLDPDWQVHSRAFGGWTVRKHDLMLWIPTDSFPNSGPKAERSGDRLPVRLPKNRIDGRYYVAIGDAGQIGVTTIHLLHTARLQLCLNLSAPAIASVLQSLTQALNSLQIPFTFAARFDPTDYHCRDTGYLEIARADYCQVQPILQQVYQTTRSAFRPGLPWGMKELAPGLGLAEQPEGISVGIHRCQLVAAALIQCWEEKTMSPDVKRQAIQQAFVQQGLDWQHPYREAGSTAEYEF